MEVSSDKLKVLRQEVYHETPSFTEHNFLNNFYYEIYLIWIYYYDVNNYNVNLEFEFKVYIRLPREKKETQRN